MEAATAFLSLGPAACGPNVPKPTSAKRKTVTFSLPEKVAESAQTPKRSKPEVPAEHDLSLNLAFGSFTTRHAKDSGAAASRGLESPQGFRAFAPEDGSGEATGPETPSPSPTPQPAAPVPPSDASPSASQSSDSSLRKRKAKLEDLVLFWLRGQKFFRELHSAKDGGTYMGENKDEAAPASSGESQSRGTATGDKAESGRTSPCDAGEAASRAFTATASSQGALSSRDNVAATPPPPAVRGVGNAEAEEPVLKRTVAYRRSPSCEEVPVAFPAAAQPARPALQPEGTTAMAALPKLSGADQSQPAPRAQQPLPPIKPSPQEGPISTALAPQSTSLRQVRTPAAIAYPAMDGASPCHALRRAPSSSRREQIALAALDLGGREGAAPSGEVDEQGAGGGRARSLVEKKRRERISLAFSDLKDAANVHGDMAHVLGEAAKLLRSQKKRLDEYQEKFLAHQVRSGLYKNLGV